MKSARLLAQLKGVDISRPASTLASLRQATTIKLCFSNHPHSNSYFVCGSNAYGFFCQSVRQLVISPITWPCSNCTVALSLNNYCLFRSEVKSLLLNQRGNLCLGQTHSSVKHPFLADGRKTKEQRN